MEELFFLFDKMLESEGLITHKGTIIDATFVDVPRQRNRRDENDKIKNGEIPEEWEKPENAAKKAQKDIDERWAKKNNETHFVYKFQKQCMHFLCTPLFAVSFRFELRIVRCCLIGHRYSICTKVLSFSKNVNYTMKM